MMYWYIFNTPWGWAAIHGEKRTMSATVLPTPAPQKLIHYIEKTGPDARFIPLDDAVDSFPVVNKIRAYYAGIIIRDWEVDLNLEGYSPFTRRVLEQVHTIPYGETRTYGEVARAIGRPGAARAVGQVMRRNPLPLIVPCHRVVARTGPGGFTSPAGIQEKLNMQAWERERLQDDRQGNSHR